MTLFNILEDGLHVIARNSARLGRLPVPWLHVVVPMYSPHSLEMVYEGSPPLNRTQVERSSGLQGEQENRPIFWQILLSHLHLIILLFFLYLLTGLYPKRILHIFEDFVSIIVFALQTDIAILRTQYKLYTYFLN